MMFLEGNEQGGIVTDDLQVDVDYFRRRVGGEILAGSMSESSGNE